MAFSPLQLFGSLGLLGASQLGRDEPGYVTEARQQLRNLMQPQNYGSIFNQTVTGLQSQFEPFLQQQEEDQIRRLQQSYINANPTLGQQGGEMAALARQQRENFLPTRQAFIGGLGLQGINQQSGAASQILGLAQPNALNQALGTLAGIMASGGFGTQQGVLGGLGSLLGGGQQGGLLQTLLGGGGTGGGLLGGAGGLLGGASGLSFGSGGAGLYGLANNIENYIAGGSGAAGSAGGQASLLSRLTGGGGLVDTSRMFAGQGLLGSPGFGSLQGLLSGAGSGLAGFGLGNLIGNQLPGQGLFSGAGGTGGGALTGFVLGGPIGAAIGGIAGLIGGLMGSSGAEARRDAAIHAVDLQAANTNKDSVGAFWTEAIGSAGGDTSAFYNQVKSFSAGDVDKVAAAGAGELLKSINASRLAQGQPAINSLDQVPGLRQGYIDWIMSNNRIESGGSLVAPGDISQQAQLLAAAGFKVEGNPGTLAVAGEDTGHTISQYFRNPDQPSQAEADELWSKVVAIKPGASKPGDWYNMPGAIMNQRAAQLIRG